MSMPYLVFNVNFWDLPSCTTAPLLPYNIFLISPFLQSGVLKGDASLAKLAQLEEFSNYLMSRSKEKVGISGEEMENCCCICYACDSDAMFKPCNHMSCFGCITRHLLNCERCFFCNATVTSVVRMKKTRNWKSSWCMNSCLFFVPSRLRL